MRISIATIDPDGGEESVLLRDVRVPCLPRVGDNVTLRGPSFGDEQDDATQARVFAVDWEVHEGEGEEDSVGRATVLVAEPAEERGIRTRCTCGPGTQRPAVRQVVVERSAEHPTGHREEVDAGTCGNCGERVVRRRWLK